MATRIIRSKDDEARMDARFMALWNQITPEIHDAECIAILKWCKYAMDYRRLMVKNSGNKHEKGYRAKMYREQKEKLPALEYYIKNKIQKP